MILLDTHVWIWWVTRQADRLPLTWTQRIAGSSETVAVASVSCLEVALLEKKRRLRLDRDINDWFAMALASAGIDVVPLTPAIAARSARLPDLHADPIDRVIVATALEHDAALLTKDATILRYSGIRVQA